MRIKTETMTMLEEERFYPLGAAEIDLVHAQHPVCEAYHTEIEENWLAEHTANPALYNGDMLLHRNIRLNTNGHLRAVAHVVSFATFLWWRKQPDRPIGQHLFSIAVPVTTDGAVLAIEMAAHTANPGRVYCAGGSLDRNDIRGDKVDIVGNMHREVSEETGIDLGQSAGFGSLRAIMLNRAVTVFRPYYLNFDADEATARVLAHMERDDEKEIAGPVIIRDGDTAGRNYAGFMEPILKFVFSPDADLLNDRRKIG
jgi:8-oxo-dGTP pyrophosphatase MutT (NUDIX family)